MMGCDEARKGKQMRVTYNAPSQRGEVLHPVRFLTFIKKVQKTFYRIFQGFSLELILPRAVPIFEDPLKSFPQHSFPFSPIYTHMYNSSFCKVVLLV